MELTQQPMPMHLWPRLVAAWSRVGPWASGLLLLFLLDAPSSVRPDRWDVLAVRPCGDVLLLLTLAAWLRFRNWRSNTLKAGVTVWVVLLVAYRLDVAIFRTITRASPVLYDQIFMAKHLLVLIGDLWGPTLALSLLAVSAAIASMVLVVILACRSWLRLATTRPRQLFAVLGSAWLVVAIATAWQMTHRPAVLMRWVSVEVARNVRTSVALYRNVERGLDESVYASLREARLSSRPDVRMVLVESYGRLMFSHPSLRGDWQSRLGELEQALSASGYYMVSAFGTASVSGGRSWIADAALLTGVDVGYEGAFQQLIGRIAKQPTLVNVLSGLGYRTYTLAPSNRERLGLRRVNRYGFDQQVEFADLDYHGRSWGWGVVPDQYSLEFFQTRVLASTEQPLFAELHLVSSHAPWSELPSMVSDWRSLGAGSAVPGKVLADAQSASPRKAAERLAGRYVMERKTMYMGGANRVLLARYRDSIRYVFDALERHLVEHELPGLIILVGDHQPPLVSPEDASFATPIHILARDPALLDEFRRAGFVPGLRPSAASKAVLSHAGFFPLIVRSLVRCCGAPGSELPAWRPEGVSLFASPGR
jgi:hypothetical protein